jgi:hypothetical protein
LRLDEFLVGSRELGQGHGGDGTVALSELHVATFQATEGCFYGAPVCAGPDAEFIVGEKRCTMEEGEEEKGFRLHGAGGLGATNLEGEISAGKHGKKEAAVSCGLFLI